MLTKEEMIAMLHHNVVPAFGCTEPVCVALAAADAAKAAGGEVVSIHVRVSGNIYKNGMAVGIPNFDKIGIPYAAALGAYMANPEQKLELLKFITPEIAGKATALAESVGVSVSVNKNQQGLYVHCEVTTAKGTGETLIVRSHANIISTKVNGKTVFEKDSGSAAEDPYLKKLRVMKISEIRALVDSASEEELAFLLEGIEMNEAAVRYSMGADRMGVGIAETMKSGKSGILGDALLGRIMRRVASATEGRLDGCPYAVMSSAGSGSKGIAVIIPVAEAAREWGSSREMTAKAIAFAHLLNEYINSYVGKLSAICACSMAASPAAAAAITWLMGGNDEQIGWSIRNMAGNITGIICDGGKVGCALKLATAAAGGLMSAMLAANSAVIRVSDGIAAETPEECIQNMGRVSNPGMVETDKEILNIMIEKERQRS